ncbi:MAG: DUF4296 domain-containing protein [Chitinophagaceae bacterium]|nr:DUF4296 domain-containing protein [Chitinophagaceae bacterium]MCW5905414.1 DUF4296 domain-containing protein [Chitinophagaceae bacterium]
MKLFTAITFSFFLFSCTGNFGKKYLPENTMKIIIWEMTCADELIRITNPTDYQLNEYAVTKDTLYQKIFAVHKITSKQFFDSYHYYRKNPVKFKTIIDSSLVYGQRQRSLIHQSAEKPLPTTTEPIKQQTKDSSFKKKLKTLKLKK